MKRMTTLLSLALVLGAPSAGRAQQPGSTSGARPVVGGGSFVTAPLLQPGDYRDTIIAGENLLYAIDLKAGQSIRVQAELAKDAPENSGLFTFAPVFYTPLREVQRLDIEFADGGRSISPGSGGRLDATNPPAKTLDEAGDDGIIYEGPGTWYVAFSGVYGRSDTPPRIETPFTFTLDVIGEPIAEKKVEFGEPERPAPEPEGTDAPPANNANEGGSTGLVVGIAAAGLLLGAGAGTVARRRRRSPG